MPLVSALMVFHRDTPYLRPAIASLLNQTLQDLELVLVDNGTGLAPEALGEMGRDPRLRWVRMPHNTGVATGHNAGLAVTRGEFIALLDSDDIALPHRLERQVAALRADPSLRLVSSRAMDIDEQGATIGPGFTLLGAREQQIFSAYTMPAATPSYSGRREIFVQHPYRSYFSVAADYDFFARALDGGGSRGLPEVLTHYRVHPTQATQQMRRAQILGACVSRLLTARRRAGRPERLEETQSQLDHWKEQIPPVADLYAHFAMLCLEEGLPLLAVYHARKLLAERRDLRSTVQALRVLGSALGAEPSHAGLLLRMFFTGPLRTHGLNPE